MQSHKAPDDVPNISSLFRIQTLLLLRDDNPKTGYDLAKELESITGKKPSSGKLYPFLHELRKLGYIDEIGSKEGGRSKLEYTLTSKGNDLKLDLMSRMENLLDIRLEQMLDKCHHCGVQLYESKVEDVEDGREIVFCCSHCREAYLK